MERAQWFHVSGNLVLRQPELSLKLYYIERQDLQSDLLS